MTDVSPPRPTLEALLREVRTSGFRVNNFFHRMDGQWQANLRTTDRGGGTAFDWAYGVDPIDAMEKALAKARLRLTMYKAAFPDSHDDLDPRVTGQTRDATAPIPEEDLAAMRTAAADDTDDLLGDPAPAAALPDDMDDLLG